MKKLKLALVGRPNVGKSALFNRLCKKRISIVDDEEGTTRDRIYGEGDFFSRKFDLIDTGGITDNFKKSSDSGVQQQVKLALAEADAVIMIVDGQVGITGSDEFVAKLLLRQKKPLFLAVNKLDNFSGTSDLYSFYRLGIKEVIGISVLHGHHIAELLELVFESFSESNVEESQEKIDNSIKVALVGRPNVGKSTLLNHLLKEERSVVSDIPGTTRDAIDAKVFLDGTEVTLIDTAGIKRKRSEHHAVEKFASVRAQLAIERSDLCLLLLDAKEGVTVQDKKIANSIEKRGKGCLLVFNKWDLVKGFRMEHCLSSFREETSFLSHCPTIFISALTRRNLPQVIKGIREVAEPQQRRISTGELNKFIERVIQAYHPPMIGGSV